MADHANSTRRAFLKTAPLVAVAAATPAMAIALHENPREKVDRLSKELSHALSEFDNGDWHARVFASNQPYGGLQLRLDNLHETQDEKVKRMARMLQFEMSKLPSIETEGGAAHEVVFGHKSFLRMADASRTDDKTLVVIGFIPRLGAPLFEPREI